MHSQGWQPVPSTAQTHQHPRRERASSHEASPLQRSHTHLRREGSKIRCRTLQSCSLHPSISSQRALGCCAAQVSGSTQWYLHHSSLFHSSRLNPNRKSQQQKTPVSGHFQSYNADRSRQKPASWQIRLPEKGRRHAKGKYYRSGQKSGQSHNLHPSRSAVLYLWGALGIVCSDHTTPKQKPVASSAPVPGMGKHSSRFLLLYPKQVD